MYKILVSDYFFTIQIVVDVKFTKTYINSVFIFSARDPFFEFTLVNMNKN